jgi:hypothetical protein
MLKRLIVLGTLFAVVVGIAVPANAGLLAYRLNGGVYNRQYWIDPNALNLATFQPIIRNAVSSWNGTPTSIYFTETTNYNSSVADFYVKDYGSVGWDGLAVPFLTGGALAAPCGGCEPTSNWDYMELSLNWYYHQNYNTQARQSVAAHEFGHGVALSHSSLGSALMNGSTQTRYYTNGTYTPQSDDISWAQQL